MIKRRMLTPEVSFINLIDVTMVLLIIFMITTPVINNLIDVDLPTGQLSRAHISEGIIVTVANDGLFYIDRSKVEPDKFEETFRSLWEDRKGEPIFLRGDKDVPYGTVITVLSTLKDIGGENVSLVVEERTEKK